MKSIPLNSNPNAKFSIGNYYPALDGLRGLAILMIILHHNFDFLSFTRPAWISLDLFFVLSGFLITGILLRQRDSPRFLKNFYGRRILRIFPIYYLSLLIFLYILPNLVRYPFSVQYFLTNQHWFWLEIQNWLFILKPDGNNNFLNHFWSLALEEQFYLLSPWIILLIKPVQKLISFLLVMLLILLTLRLALWSIHLQNISYINVYAFTRIDGLCVGSLLAIFNYQKNFKLKKINKAIGSLFLLLIFIIIPSCKFFLNIRLPYLACCLFPAIALFWGLIVWFSAQANGFIFRIFNNRAFIFFGKISYGLYIFHWPVFRLIKLSENLPGDQHLFRSGVAVAVISTSIAILMAIISYYSFEKYFLGLKRYFT